MNIRILEKNRTKTQKEVEKLTENLELKKQILEIINKRIQEIENQEREEN